MSATRIKFDLLRMLRMPSRRLKLYCIWYECTIVSLFLPAMDGTHSPFVWFCFRICVRKFCWNILCVWFSVRWNRLRCYFFSANSRNTQILQPAYTQHKHCVKKQSFPTHAYPFMFFSFLTFNLLFAYALARSNKFWTERKTRSKFITIIQHRFRLTKMKCRHISLHCTRQMQFFSWRKLNVLYNIRNLLFHVPLSTNKRNTNNFH